MNTLIKRTIVKELNILKLYAGAISFKQNLATRGITLNTTITTLSSICIIQDLIKLEKLSVEIEQNLIDAQTCDRL